MRTRAKYVTWACEQGLLLTLLEIRQESRQVATKRGAALLTEKLERPTSSKAFRQKRALVALKVNAFSTLTT